MRLASYCQGSDVRYWYLANIVSYGAECAELKAEGGHTIDRAVADKSHMLSGS
jgi:hypothetical protein